LPDAIRADIKWTWMGSGDFSRMFDGKVSVINELWESVRADIAQPFRGRATRILAEREYAFVEGRGAN
jgi:hypothetical protein